MPQLAATTYQKLLKDIGALYEGARRALVEAYWQIGKRIVEVEQKGEMKAAHGSGLLRKLSEDLSKNHSAGFSYTNLKDMRRFYLSFPNRQPAGELSWSQHVELLKIPDKDRRKTLERKAVQGNMSRNQLRSLIRRELVREQVAENLSSKPDSVLRTPSSVLLTIPQDLTLHTYQRAEIPSATGYAIDCGFYVLREVTKKQYDSVTITAKPSYTYEAVVEKVIDGDTIWAVMDAGFGTYVREKLRLRGIDCPEIDTEEGKRAKAFVEKQLTPYHLSLTPQKSILIKTQRSDDKYGRFVADIFYEDKTGTQQYLNNLILEQGLAVRVQA